MLTVVLSTDDESGLYMYDDSDKADGDCKGLVALDIVRADKMQNNKRVIRALIMTLFGYTSQYALMRRK